MGSGAVVQVIRGTLPTELSGSGDGSGSGYGDGYGDGSGSGGVYGYGSGSGDGYGSGEKTSGLTVAQRQLPAHYADDPRTLALWKSDADGKPANGGSSDEAARPGL